MPDKEINCSVIVADDYAPDLELLVYTLKTETHFRIVYAALDGSEVIAYLKGGSPFDDRERFPFPQLLILDLKMIKIDGFEVLKWIQTNPVPPLVIVVLTGSEDPQNAARAKELGADAVFIKPVSLEHIRKMASRIESFMETVPKGIVC